MLIYLAQVSKKNIDAIEEEINILESFAYMDKNYKIIRFI